MIRCAIQQEFNSLDARREAAEAFVVSQKQVGWQVAADRYDDSGYTGVHAGQPKREAAINLYLFGVDSSAFPTVGGASLGRLAPTGYRTGSPAYVNINLDGQATTKVPRGEAVQAVQDNPRVAASRPPRTPACGPLYARIK